MLLCTHVGLALKANDFNALGAQKKNVHESVNRIATDSSPKCGRMHQIANHISKFFRGNILYLRPLGL